MYLLEFVIMIWVVLLGGSLKWNLGDGKVVFKKTFWGGGLCRQVNMRR